MRRQILERHTQSCILSSTKDTLLTIQVYIVSSVTNIIETCYKKTLSRHFSQKNSRYSKKTLSRHNIAKKMGIHLAFRINISNNINCAPFHTFSSPKAERINITSSDDSQPKTSHDSPTLGVVLKLILFFYSAKFAKKVHC